MYIGNPQLSLSRLISCAIKNCHQELGGSGRIYYKLIFQGFPRGIRDCGKIKNCCQKWGVSQFKPKYCLTLEICFNRGIKIRIDENMSQYAFMMSAAMLHKAHTRDNRHQPPFLLLPRQHGPPPFEIRFQFVIF